MAQENAGPGAGPSAEPSAERSTDRSTDRPGGRIGAREAAQEAVAYLDEMTGQPPEAVTGVEPAPDGGWTVTAELVELTRVPGTTDIVGCYQVTLDPTGEPVSYRRVRRYQRGQVGDD
jgi:hypothetical protein